jgi:hypothetical protein
VSEEFSAAVRAKAARYIRQERVMQDADKAEVWWVEGGDPNRPYRVQVTLDGREVLAVTCSCPHGSHTGGGEARCAHALAALVKIRDKAETKGETDGGSR